ncbi:hypothetical protein [Phenylobacterium sp.]|uniref:hypothetical protein n=1 Tax=Phenylobacterium sp. TaxID=1871053 RepID=UPI00286E9B52|nr:hypothetical protein [Phenylobacterium sp.]
MGIHQTPRAATPLQLAKPYPEIYAVVPHGACMEPEFKHGVPIIVSSIITPVAGDTVIIHLKPAAQALWGYEAIVKRLKYGLHGLEFPWEPGASNVVASIVVEQLNPPRSFDLWADQIGAVHKVMGVGKRGRDGQVTASRRTLELA